MGGGDTSEDHEYVDLGLSVLWATTNIGAESETDYGNYYAWGETATKTGYTSANYTDPECSSTTLDATHDAATANWGSDWRMPTRSEFNELMSNCTWTCTQKDNVNGLLLTSKMDGYTDKSIFLPAAGYYNSSNLTQNSVYGLYWTSTPFDETSSYEFNFSYFAMLTSNKRYYGYTIRPVRAKQ